MDVATIVRLLPVMFAVLAGVVAMPFGTALIAVLSLIGSFSSQIIARPEP